MWLERLARPDKTRRTLTPISPIDTQKIYIEFPHVYTELYLFYYPVFPPYETRRQLHLPLFHFMPAAPYSCYPPEDLYLLALPRPLHL